jgi:chromosome segregation ATPase
MQRILSLFVVVALCSCTIRYTAKVAPNRKALDRLNAQTVQLARSVDQARKERQGLISQCRRQGADLKQAPYPELQKILKRAANHRRSMQAKEQNLHKLRKRFQRITRGKKRLVSDRPEWKQFKSIRSQAQELVEVMKGLSAEAQKTFKAFDAAARKAKLGHVDGQKIVRQAGAQISTLKQQLRRATPQIRKAQKQFEEAPHLKPESKALCSEALAAMAQAHGDIRSLIGGLEDGVAQIKGMRSIKGKIPMCPNLLAHRLLPQIQADAQAISAHVAAINAAQSRCQKALK